MLKLGKLADYATMLMTAMARMPAQVYTAHDLATRTHVAAPTTAKLLKLLSKAGLIESLRGVHGGYRLSREPQRITVAEIVNAVEGPIAVTECSERHSDCSIEASCTTRANWRLINSAIRQALEAVTLAQMATPMRRSESPIHFQQTAQAGGR
ncbi:MAG TPA: SUF system Fe-S cluster assembly regulator [Stenotrophobium sp.]|jgi:FeS assembly SUF system regulator|nr:SUF system Fe-S cluster assembly regulator [Stenotrophobium sp.]